MGEGVAMRRRTYPRVVRRTMGYQGRKTCTQCLQRTAHWVDIQTSQFRGDDLVMKLCRACQDELNDEAILALYEKTHGRDANNG